MDLDPEGHRTSGMKLTKVTDEQLVLIIRCGSVNNSSFCGLKILLPRNFHGLKCDRKLATIPTQSDSNAKKSLEHTRAIGSWGGRIAIACSVACSVADPRILTNFA